MTDKSMKTEYEYVSLHDDITKPVINIKHRHSVAGHTYSKVCGRGCYLITRPGPWVRCECSKSP
jgi:hypothetical protein